MEFEYNGETLFVAFGMSYANGSLALEAVDARGATFARLSVNMPGDPPPDGVFFLKDWSENADVAAALVASGLIERADDVEPRTSGFIVAHAWRIKGGVV